MNYGELLSHFLVDLQSIYRKNISIQGASFPQVLTISIIPDDGIEMSMLSNKIGIDNSTATRMIAGLEKKGWVYRQPFDHDKRIIKVYLTELGINIQEKLEDQIERIGSVIEQEVDPLDRNEMIELISSLHWILSKLILKGNIIV